MKKPSKEDLKLADDIASGKIKNIRQDAKQDDGLRQRFGWVESIQAVGGVLMLTTSKEAKALDERKYRDRLIPIHRAIDHYFSVGMLCVDMSRQGYLNIDEFMEILHEFGWKIIEAIQQCRSMNYPLDPKHEKKILAWEQQFLEYDKMLRVKEAMPELDNDGKSKEAVNAVK